MKKRTIKYLEKYYCIIINMVLILFFVLLLVISIREKQKNSVFILLIVISFFVYLTFVFGNYNIVFNYDNYFIKVLEPGSFRYVKVLMDEVQSIQFFEVKSQKKSLTFLHEVLLFNFNPVYTYNYGKMYYIEILKTNGSIIRISYNSLYKCRNKKRMEKFENKVNEIIKEFNNFKYDKYFKK